MVLKNTEIAVRCGMMMHHIIMNCVANNIAVPVFTDRGFVEKVLNYIKDPSNLLVTQAKNAFDPLFRPVNETLDGRPWLLGYLAKIITAILLPQQKQSGGHSSRTVLMPTESFIFIITENKNDTESKRR
jgi:hypothetical protein